MTQHTIKPSILRIIQSDRLATMAVIAPLVFLFVYLLISYSGFFPGFQGSDPNVTNESSSTFLFIMLASWIIGVLLLVWRIRSIQKIFANGIEITGLIKGVTFFRDRGVIEFSYNYLGQPYTTSSAVMKTGSTQSLHYNEEIVLIVDRDNPRRALVRDLYI